MDSKDLDFPNITTTLTNEALILRSRQLLRMLSSAVVGGGFLRAQCIINRHVHKNYDHPDPGEDLRTFATQQGIVGPFVGLMTAAYVERARAVTLRSGNLTVAAVITAGLSNPTSAGLSPPAPPISGTINTILLVDGNLAPAAMVNAVMTATEAKTDLLRERGVHTPEGFQATGTSTDAAVIACTGQGALLPYAGPATEVGWLIGRCVRKATSQPA